MNKNYSLKQKSESFLKNILKFILEIIFKRMNIQYYYNFEFKKEI